MFPSSDFVNELKDLVLLQGNILLCPCCDTCLPGNQGQLVLCSLTQHTLFRERLGTCLEKDKGVFTTPHDGHVLI